MVEVAVVGFLGALSGGFLGSLASRSRMAALPLPWRRRRDTAEEVLDWIEPEVSAQINDAARMWAQDHSRPEAAETIAAKLRLAHQLRTRRDRGW